MAHNEWVAICQGDDYNSTPCGERFTGDSVEAVGLLCIAHNTRFTITIPSGDGGDEPYHPHRRYVTTDPNGKTTMYGVAERKFEPWKH